MNEPFEYCSNNKGDTACVWWTMVWFTMTHANDEFTAGAMNPDITGAGAQNSACSRENGVRQGQNAGISQQETLADDEPEDNEFLDFSFGM